MTHSTGCPAFRRLPRRSFRQIGTLASLGLMLPDSLRHATTSDNGSSSAKPRSAILIFNSGSPAHHETIIVIILLDWSSCTVYSVHNPLYSNLCLERELSEMIQPNALADQVYEHLLGKILAGQFPAGHQFRETELATQLGVSRTPIRQALTRLAEYGLIENRANRSAIVRHLNPEELVHVHQVREALEGMATELACHRLTPADIAHLQTLADTDADVPEAKAACLQLEYDLHQTLATRSGNPILAREVIRLHRLVMLFHLRTGTSHEHATWRNGHLEHRMILAALKSGDSAASRQAMIDHVRTSCQQALRGMSAMTTTAASTAPREATMNV